MAKKISKELLYALRNQIPVWRLIEYFLEMPCKISEGYFRFLCPKCKNFRTAVHPETNLARCFVCKCNYNCIDLIIISEQVSFLDAVKILSPLLNQELYQFPFSEQK